MFHLISVAIIRFHQRTTRSCAHFWFKILSVDLSHVGLRYCRSIQQRPGVPPSFCSAKFGDAARPNTHPCFGPRRFHSSNRIQTAEDSTEHGCDGGDCEWGSCDQLWARWATGRAGAEATGEQRRALPRARRRQSEFDSEDAQFRKEC